jgi:threonyl-tRNA synthetase
MDLSLLKPRHSLAHILAQAVQQTIDPLVSLGTGPAVDDGFYYDMLFSDGISVSPDSLKDLTKIMQGIAKQWQEFTLYTAADQEEALIIIALMGGHADAVSDATDMTSPSRFKRELIGKFATAAAAHNTTPTYTFYLNTIPAIAADKLLTSVLPAYTSLYTPLNTYFQDKTGEITRTDDDGIQTSHTINFSEKCITFIDLCEGPHVDTTKQIADGSFILERIAGAYRQAKESNPQLTRLYWLAFASKDDLKTHQTMMEEAKKRDHRTIGAQMKLFAFDEEVGPGLPLWLPNGAIMVEELEALAKQKEQEYGYLRVRSPHITKESLYIKSGHLPYYAEDMFPPMDLDGEKYYLKPMNCPHHHKIFDATPKSYRDLPARYAEYGHCYRYEDSGSLMGLMRVRSLCMNDAHIYCTPEQFADEFLKVIELYIYYFKLFGIEKYQMRLSKHSTEGLGKKYVDQPELWIQTEAQVREVMIKSWVPFVEAEDEAAFYGPKIDVQIRSVIGREFTLATNQLDFAVPARFNLTYTDRDGSAQTPLCIHRAPLSTHERFIGFLIEHYAGVFPLWLAPQQIMIIPVAEPFTDYATSLKAQCIVAGLRAHLDDSSDSFSKKIRNAEIEKIPYIVIVGEKEVTDNSVSVRIYKTKEQLTVPMAQFIAERVKEYRERA